MNVASIKEEIALAKQAIQNAPTEVEKELYGDELAELETQLAEARKTAEGKQAKATKTADNRPQKQAEDLKEELSHSDCLKQVKAYKAKIEGLERKSLAQQARAKGKKMTNEEAEKMPKTTLMEAAGQAKNTLTPDEGKEKAVAALIKWELKGNKGYTENVNDLEAEEKKRFKVKYDTLVEKAQAKIKELTQPILDALEKEIQALFIKVKQPA